MEYCHCFFWTRCCCYRWKNNIRGIIVIGITTNEVVQTMEGLTGVIAEVVYVLGEFARHCAALLIYTDHEDIKEALC